MTDRTITINVRALVNDLIGPMRQASSEVKTFAVESEGALKSVEASSERISHLWKSAFEAFIGFEAVESLKRIAEGASEAADQLAVASRVAKNFGNSFDPGQFEKWLDAFARSAQSGGYGVDEMRDSVQQFTALGLSAAQTQRALADTANLAASRNISFAEATNIVRQALTGHVEMLSRYGIVSREAAKNIHTVEQAMDALESATSGAAQERSDGLAGSFGRLSTAGELLGKTVGTALIPIFDRVAIVLTNAANLVARIPAPVMTAVASFAALVIGLAAVALGLPAIAKGFAIVREGLNLLLIPFGPLGRALLFAKAGFLDMAAAELAPLVPIAAIIAAIAGIVVAMVELTNHMDHVKTAWHAWTQYLSDAFSEFVDNFKRDHTVLMRLMADLAAAATNPAMAGKLAEDWALATPKATIKDGPKLGSSTEQIGTDIIGDWSKIIGRIKNFFGSAIGGLVNIPHPTIPGVVPGTTKDGSAAAAENALKNFEESTKNWLAQFQARVDAAKSTLDIASEKLADFDVKHPSDEPMSDADRATRQSLVNQEIAAEQGLRARTLDQEKAEVQAAAEYEAIAKRISPTLKNHDELVRQALDGAREHAKAARDLYLNYLQAGTALDSIIAKERQATNERVDAARDRANATLEGALTERDLGRDTRAEALSHAAAMQSVGNPANQLAADRLAIALDNLTVAAKGDTVATLQHEVANARLAFNATGTADDLNKLNAATAAYHAAILANTKAEDQRDLDIAKLTADQRSRWTNLIDGLISKLNVPGLTATQGKISFDPMQMMLAAFEKTKSFADIMTVVNSIMNVFAQVIDALRPIIDALLEVVIGVVKVFISLYNGIVSILRLLGIHIAYLQLQNQAEATQAPLLQIYHDLPTLQEANNPNAQKALTLTAIDQAYQSNITNPLKDALANDNLGGGLFGILGEVLGAILAIKVIMGLMGASTGGGWLGGVAQSILKMFGVGGGAGSAPGLQNALNAINNLPDVAGQTQAVQSGVTSAFAHGTTMTFSTIASAISGAFEGFELGQVTSKMFGTSSPAWGEALGAAGGVAGGLFGAGIATALGLHLGMLAGPLGALAGAVLGAVVGGMIGPHWGPATNYPDRSDTSNYGAFVSNMSGTTGSYNGQQINAQGPYNVANGGTGIATMLRDWVTSALPKDMSSTQLAILNQLKSLGGANGQFGIKSEYNGMFTLFSGQQVAVTAYEALVKQFLGAVQDPLSQLGGSLAEMATNVRTNVNSLNELTGQLTAVNSRFRDLSNGLASAAQPAGITHTGDINIEHSGDINGFAGLDEFMEQAAIATSRAYANRRFLLSGAPQS
jgi:hypothetical protein